MLEKIIKFSLNNKLIILLLVGFTVAFGVYSIFKIPIGAVPDITNNQVQVITTSRNLSTEDIEQFITYPVELEMANLPGVKEIRSISKFGLSVVTIVFEDDLGTYLPRQLIAEKIKIASEKIPKEFGTPEMGPITTGLGEIYQYILDVKPEHKHKYSTTDLRTIQDWIVKRQLSGIPGVVEINTWGGYLKQYEVAINSNKLKAMNIKISDVFSALEKNNSIAGGSYIEKNNTSYFIRGEGLIKSLEDINNIVVKTNETTIYIRDIAKVDFGSAVRFGAITGNAEGEKVLGQVMMLKDQNSLKVINSVKERVSEIQKTLPEGVYINGFLDRTELINKTTYTITENLLLGSLIVIFIVVLLLGNIRSGLVIASVIPLSLLFAISLMSIFKIDANLMSLGAIDFGIIIDGAVIIVEFISFKLMSNVTKASNLEQKQIDNITLKSASKMMNSAIFGQLIIIIVFIPILSLKGIEGKMFTPMAIAFSFALIGAMLLCLTYVPVVSSLFLNSKKSNSLKVSTKLITGLKRIYKPSLELALNNKNIVLSAASVLLFLSFFIFNKMGGEFVPTLDEGDFVIQPVLKTGTSLEKTIEITTKIEEILLNTFEEVEQVVSRIGAAEVPTDPMSMEESDVIIKLKPKNTWVNAKSKDELADKIKQALSVIPNMEIEFTQPIEMRFNELITGVRADVAIKVFGEDLNMLAKIAENIKNEISDTEGAADIIVEKIEGLPQMNVSFNRSKIARYGLNISDINKIITMGFSGAVVGDVYEGEKRFNLVLRYQKDKRNSIQDLSNLLIDTPFGYKIPLHEVAKISYTQGPAKISRDNTKRRAVVGINVRNKDLQSVVNEVQSKINNSIKLPTGYSITYSGQFENLQNAKERLYVAVPIALALIFLLLYFAFNSVKEALLVYSAIPLATVGGILLLWFRDLPFSISAGIGFIALFGIAVLNGIVLIEHYKDIMQKNTNDFKTIIIEGTSERLRPVLLTALAAAFGFLPMAISTSAGAEVQRPLATVVIGGLISSTILTLYVLPILYHWLVKRKANKRSLKGAKTLLFILFATQINAQTKLNYNETLALAEKNNAKIKASKLKVDEKEELINNAFSLEKTNIYYSFDENNLAINNLPIRVFGISQDFKFPTFYSANKKVKQAEFNIEKTNYYINLQKLKEAVSAKYYELSFKKNENTLYKYLDSIFLQYATNAEKKYKIGEISYLDWLTAKSKYRYFSLLYKQSNEDVKIARQKLKSLVQVENLKTIDEPLEKLILEKNGLEKHLGVKLLDNVKNLEENLYNLDRQNYLPDINLEYFQGTNSQLNRSLRGYQIGLKIPLFLSKNTTKIKARKLAIMSIDYERINYNYVLKNKEKELLSNLEKHKEAIDYYETEGRILKNEILKTAKKNLNIGEIDFLDYAKNIETAMQIDLEYLRNLNQYNQIVIQINYQTFNLN